MALRQRVVKQHPEQPWERLTLAQIEFEWRGSTRPMDEFFASLPAAELSSPRGQLEQRNWALIQGKVAEALRLEGSRAKDGDRVDGYEDVRVGAAMASVGDLPGARASLEKTADALRAQLKLDPRRATRNGAYLAMIDALLGKKDEALRWANQVVESDVSYRDVKLCRAFVIAWTGDKDRAVAEYARLLQAATECHNTSQIPNVHVMEHDPLYHPMHGDPRFEALINDPKNNAPLF